jgi:UMF1 family MFS transporter
LQDEGLPDSALAVTEALAGLTVIVLAPFIGARSDRSGRRLPGLAITTGIAVGATAALATFSPTVTLVLLGLGLIGLNIGAALYDALLASVAEPEERGRMSGFGVGVGYLGSFIGLGLGRLAFDVLDAGYVTTFRLLAAGFLLFSLPLFFWLREAPARQQSPPSLRLVLTGLIDSWKAASRTPGIMRFLTGRFLYTDAINTLIGGFLAIFVLTELELDTSQVNSLLGLAIAAAIVGGLGGGRLVQRLGAQTTLRAALLSWVVAIVLGVVAAHTASTELIWLVGAIGGAALGATWTADRVLMLELSPPARLGEFYGLYATVGRFATILGPLVWATVVDGLGWGRSMAMLILAGFVLAGFFVILGVRPGTEHIRS